MFRSGEARTDTETGQKSRSRAQTREGIRCCFSAKGASSLRLARGMSRGTAPRRGSLRRRDAEPLTHLGRRLSVAWDPARDLSCVHSHPAGRVAAVLSCLGPGGASGGRCVCARDSAAMVIARKALEAYISIKRYSASVAEGDAPSNGLGEPGEEGRDVERDDRARVRGPEPRRGGRSRDRPRAGSSVCGRRSTRRRRASSSHSISNCRRSRLGCWSTR